MEDLDSIWVYQENVEELKEKLLYRTLELESLKMAATEEIRKIEENVKSLQELLKMACQERDEARTQLQILMKRILCSDDETSQTRLPRTLSENPMLVHGKANSSITESNSLSNNSPAVSSPEFSNINMADSRKMGGFNEQFSIDPSLKIIGSVAKGKPLPQKGKLMQAIMEAGPLLQTLLVAGALPRWRNPPPLEPLQAPSFSITGSQSLNIDQNPSSKSSFSAQKDRISSSYPEIFRGPSRICSRTPPGHCFDVPDGKRQRFQ